MERVVKYRGVAIGVTIIVHVLLFVSLYFPKIKVSLEPFLQSDAEMQSVEEIEEMILELNLLEILSENQGKQSSGESGSSSQSGNLKSESSISNGIGQGVNSQISKILGAKSDSLQRSYSGKIERIAPLVVQKSEPDIVLEKELQVTMDSSMIALVEQIRHNDQIRNNRSQSRIERLDFYRTNYRTIYNYLKVYTYALIIRDIMFELDSQLLYVSSGRERRVLIKKTEKELFERFEKVVRKMTYSQGKILLKLIARETGQSTYDIIRNYKGALTAGFWYNIGKLFTANLKVEYDKEGEDKVLEEILQRSEKGEYLLVDKGVYLH